MKKNHYKSSLFIAFLFTIAIFAISCGGGGGGGGGGGPTPSPPLIVAELISFPWGSEPPGFDSNASVYVIDNSSSLPITNAIVTMNGVTLTYNANLGEYKGHVVVGPGMNVSLSVIVGSNTYSASATQFNSYPTISAPASGATLHANINNTVTWSGGSPTNNAIYGIGVLDAADPNGQLIWPVDHFLQTVSIGTTDYTIPAYSLTAGERFLVVGIAMDTPVPILNASSGSYLLLSGFNYVPFTVVDDSGKQWTQRTPLGSFPQYYYPDLQDIIWSGTHFVAVGRFDILTSPDGITWTQQNGVIPYDLLSVTWSGTQFVAVGHYTILTSPDGITWTPQTSNTTNSLLSVTWSGTQFVAVGAYGTILTSPDGVTWTPQTSNTTNNLWDVIWSGSQFVAVGGSGTVLTSVNGTTWIPQTSNTSNDLRGVTWSGTQFVSVGGDTILTSPDGVTWTPQTSGTTGLSGGIAWSGANFVAVGWGGVIFTSPDGVTWTPQTSGTIFSLYGVTWSGTKFVAVGDGIILTSP